MGGAGGPPARCHLSLAHVKSSVGDDRADDYSDSEAETLLIVRAAEASELEPGYHDRVETL